MGKFDGVKKEHNFPLFPTGCKDVPQPAQSIRGYASDVFLRIDGLTEASKIINLAEITAYDKDNKVIKPAYTALSSTNYIFSVGRCFDGSKGNFCHTKPGDSNPHLLVRYDGAKLRKITVTNRPPGTRIVGANFQICSDEKCADKVHFSGKFEGVKTEHNFPLFPTGCKDVPQPAQPICGYASDVFLRIDGLTEASKIINLAEITAYDKDNKVIKPAYTALSSTNYIFSVGRCFDGSKGNFCHTKPGDSNPYLLVRYDGAKLRKITVTNRGANTRIVGANFQICSDENCAYKVLFSAKFDGTKKEYNFPLFPT